MSVVLIVEQRAVWRTLDTEHLTWKHVQAMQNCYLADEQGGCDVTTSYTAL